MQNIYDNEEFHEGYLKMRNNGQNYNDYLEVPAFRNLLPNVKDRIVADFGCGCGENCVYYIEKGAKSVVGIDISEKMIQKAREINGREGITYYSKPIETIEVSEGTFDLITSSLAFHYIEDFDALAKKLFKMLGEDGILIFSQEHPIMTANKNIKAWIKDENGNKLFWPVDNYCEDGKRVETWIVDGVIKFHRSLSSILNSLINAGFIIEKVLEPVALEEGLKVNPTLNEVSRRPVFLIIRARKTKNIA